MRVEDPAAYKYLFNDDVFLLSTEKHLFNGAATPAIEQPIEAELPKVKAKAEIPAEPIAPKPIQYLGQNKKGFVVLTHYTDAQFIADDHQTALEATLKRKDHTIDDIAIVNIAGNADASLSALLQQLSPKRLLVLGKQAIPAGLNGTGFNQAQQINSLPVLVTFAFGEMMSSNDNKKAFWEQVKNF